MQIMAPGTFAPMAEPLIRLDLNAAPLRLADFTDGIRGDFTVVSNLRGPLRHPEGSIAVSGRTIDLGFQRLHAVRLSARLDGDSLRLDDAAVDIHEGETIRGTRWVAADRNFELNLSSNAISVDHIDRLGEQDVFQGKVMLDLSAAGTLDDPRASGNLTVRDVRINRKALDDFTVHMDLADGLARVRGRPYFDLEGSFHLKTGDMTADLRFQETELAPFFYHWRLSRLRGHIDRNDRRGGQRRRSRKNSGFPSIFPVSA